MGVYLKYTPWALNTKERRIKLDMKAFSALWHTHSSIFPCWEGNVASWVGKLWFSWIFLFLLICTLIGTAFFVLVLYLTFSGKAKYFFKVELCFSEFCGWVCKVLWFCLLKCQDLLLRLQKLSWDAHLSVWTVLSTGSPFGRNLNENRYNLLGA